MREIKFRAWDKDLKRWCFSTEVTLEGSGQYIHHHYPKTGHQPKDINQYLQVAGCEHIEAICQFTGLKDKNDVEIYEGDIVHTTDGWGNESTSKVMWGDIDGDYPEFYPAFDLEPRINDELNSFAYAYESGDVTVEIIGNIYENQDLLK